MEDGTHLGPKRRSVQGEVLHAHHVRLITAMTLLEMSDRTANMPHLLTFD